MEQSNQNNALSEQIKFEFTQKFETDLADFRMRINNKKSLEILELDFNFNNSLNRADFKEIAECIKGIAGKLKRFALNLKNPTYQLQESDYAQLTEALKPMPNNSKFTFDMRKHEINEKEGRYIVTLFRQLACAEKNLIVNKFSYKSIQGTDADLNEVATILNQPKEITKFKINCSDASITDKGIRKLGMLLRDMDNLEDLDLNFRNIIKLEKSATWKLITSFQIKQLNQLHLHHLWRMGNLTDLRKRPDDNRDRNLENSASSSA